MLTTIDAVAESLGGWNETAKAVGRSRSAVGMWKSTGGIPADFYLLLQGLLAERGARADDELFNMVRLAPEREDAA